MDTIRKSAPGTIVSRGGLDQRNLTNNYQVSPPPMLQTRCPDLFPLVLGSFGTGRFNSTFQYRLVIGGKIWILSRQTVSQKEPPIVET